jgi:hypothetical protein
VPDGGATVIPAQAGIQGKSGKRKAEIGRTHAFPIRSPLSAFRFEKFLASRPAFR